jgi:dihydroflavonol-4-reductase
MRTVFLTGATGLIGSNMCRLLVEQGDAVRALARPGSETGPLLDLGATVVEGDITDVASVRRAAEGCEVAIHSAAVLGGPHQDPDEHRAVNIAGVHAVFDAAEAVGMRRVVTLGTTTYFDASSAPLTETSPVDPDAPLDPYTQTKREAYLEARRRAASTLDVCVVIPGGTFGPAPCASRAMEPPSFNLRLVWALEGTWDAAVHFPVPWSLASDVAAASVAALDRGVRGETYLAFGTPEAVTSMAAFGNRACELAGVTHRTLDVTAAMLDADPALVTKVGPSLTALAHRRFPEPYFVNDHTRRQLGYEPTPFDDALAQTIAWLRATHLQGRGI